MACLTSHPVRGEECQRMLTDAVAALPASRSASRRRQSGATASEPETQLQEETQLQLLPSGRPCLSSR